MQRFMAKPKFGIAGSGMHCNMSLLDQDGNNAFFDPVQKYAAVRNSLPFLGWFD